MSIHNEKKKNCNIRHLECFRKKVCHVRYAYLGEHDISYLKIKGRTAVIIILQQVISFIYSQYT